MKQKTIPDFIVIDDDALNNMICIKIIRMTVPESTIHTFTDPEKGIEYINSTLSVSNANKAILFLNINMPNLSGWDVLEILEKAGAGPERIKIFILSSSASINDIKKAGTYSIVSSFIGKPLSQVKLKSILHDI